jgi:hypothetical protein
LLAVEVDREHAVIWTKPDDLEYSPDKPLEGLSNSNGCFFAAFANGKVFPIKRLTDGTIAKLFSADGGEAVDVEAAKGDI